MHDSEALTYLSYSVSGPVLSLATATAAAAAATTTSAARSISGALMVG